MSVFIHSVPGTSALRLHSLSILDAAGLMPMPRVATRGAVLHSVHHPAEPRAAFCLFFRASMNGRGITSWGINPALQITGTVTRALYEPCGRWHYRQAGVLLKRDGIESRSFYFATAAGGVSAAEDGALIGLWGQESSAGSTQAGAVWQLGSIWHRVRAVGPRPAGTPPC